MTVLLAKASIAGLLALLLALACLWWERGR